MLANFSSEELTIPKATILGVAEEVSESLVDKINSQAEFNADSPTRPPRIKRNEALLNKLLLGKLDHLTSENRQHNEPILRKYAHVFHGEDTNDFKATHVTEHQIFVGDARPTRKPPYRTPFALRQEMQKMLEKGVIRESNSPWSAPALLVPKRSLDGKPKFRFCVDFRVLNSVTKFDPYPLPNFNEATATLHGSKYFSVLDCYSGFWQMNIKEEHKELTGFSVPSGHYEFNRLPFGLKIAPRISREYCLLRIPYNEQTRANICSTRQETFRRLLNLQISITGCQHHITYILKATDTTQPKCTLLSTSTCQASSLCNTLYMYYEIMK
jgi:hypothetical protein